MYGFTLPWAALQTTRNTPRCGHNAALATAPCKHPKGRPPHRDTGNGPCGERAIHGSSRGPRGPKTAGIGHFRAPNRLKSMGLPAGLKQNAIARCWPCGCQRKGRQNAQLEWGSSNMYGFTSPWRLLQTTITTPKCGHNAAVTTPPYKHPRVRPPHRDTGNGPCGERSI